MLIFFDSILAYGKTQSRQDAENTLYEKFRKCVCIEKNRIGKDMQDVQDRIRTAIHSTLPLKAML